MILYFSSFSFFESSIMKSKKVGKDHFSDYSLKIETIMVKYVKPINSLKNSKQSIYK